MLLIAMLFYMSILRSPLFFGDDALRVFTHTSINQGVHGRPLADLAYGVLSGGLFVDMSPLSQVLALAFMLMAGMLIARVFVPQATTEKHLARWTPLFYVLLPLNFSIISYRYDSLGFALAIFFSSLAFFFIFHEGNRVARVIIAGICLWITLSTYQIMVCMYYCACFWGLAHFSFRESFIEILKKCYLIFFSTVIALLSYLPIYIQAVKNASSPFCGLPNHPYVSQHAVILDKSIFFEGIKDNILLFMYTAKGYFLGGGRCFYMYNYYIDIGIC